MMNTMLKSVAKSDKNLQALEREALKLEEEKLSKAARATLIRMQGRVNELRQAMKEIQSLEPFSPKRAGERVVAELQTTEGGSLSGAQLKDLFDLTAAVLHRRRKEKRIVYWRDSRHDFFYPKWQFTQTGALLPGIQDILRIFNSDDEWRIMRYFLGAREQLNNRSPLDMLRAGEIEKVLSHARDHAAENTW